VLGNKPAEGGRLPSDWSVDVLGNVCAITTGRKDVNEGNPNGQFPFFTCSRTYTFSDSFSFDTKAILIAGNGDVGNLHYYDGKFEAYQRTYVLHSFSTPLRFLWWQLNYRLAESLGLGKIGSSIPYIKKANLTHFAFPVPPTEHEQEAIAESLGDADAFIESLEQLLAKKRAIMQGAMQELLTGKRRLPGFIGEWSNSQLGAHGTFLKGTGIKRSDVGSGSIGCVRYGELYTTYNNVIRHLISRISSDVTRQSTKLNLGDVLFAGSGETKTEIGKCAAFILHEEAYAGGDIIIFRTFKCCPTFLGYYLNTPPIAIQKAHKGQGDAVVHISSQSLSHIFVSLPERPEQEAIADVLSDIDNDIAATEAKLDKARDIRQGMMQQLLTGKVRLV